MASVSCTSRVGRQQQHDRWRWTRQGMNSAAYEAQTALVRHLGHVEVETQNLRIENVGNNTVDFGCEKL